MASQNPRWVQPFPSIMARSPSITSSRSRSRSQSPAESRSGSERQRSPSQDAPPAPRKRGRPRKTAPSVRKTPVKRGRGRPKKQRTLKQHPDVKATRGQGFSLDEVERKFVGTYVPSRMPLTVFCYSSTGIDRRAFTLRPERLGGACEGIQHPGSHSTLGSPIP